MKTAYMTAAIAALASLLSLTACNKSDNKTEQPAPAESAKAVDENAPKDSNEDETKATENSQELIANADGYIYQPDHIMVTIGGKSVKASIKFIREDEDINNADAKKCNELKEDESCDAYVVFEDDNVHVIKRSGDIGLYIKNAGDLNGDGSDELIVFDTPIRSANPHWIESEVLTPKQTNEKYDWGTLMMPLPINMIVMREKPFDVIKKSDKEGYLTVQYVWAKNIFDDETCKVITEEVELSKIKEFKPKESTIAE